MIIKKKNEQKKEITKEPEKKEETLDDTLAKDVDIFDLDNIEFSQRQERRRGDRRRGYRRIDDRNLISRAQEEAGTIRETAAKEGYQEGLNQAREDLNMLKSNIQSFMNSKKEVFDYVAPNILQISLDIAAKIIKKEAAQDPQIILDSIRDILDNISKEESKITITVNPMQSDLIKEHISEITSQLAIDAKINILNDDIIELGGCIIQTSNGIVDATINTQLEIVKEAFKGK